jgi:hypothetical protein
MILVLVNLQIRNLKKFFSTAQEILESILQLKIVTKKGFHMNFIMWKFDLMNRPLEPFFLI